ncbi:MAG: hypothetical protein Q8N26_05340 [Myxococcales bacterium]|nr:hypothetical protein [Myxococcales bacterium]
MSGGEHIPKNHHRKYDALDSKDVREGQQARLNDRERVASTPPVVCGSMNQRGRAGLHGRERALAREHRADQAIEPRRISLDRADIETRGKGRTAIDDSERLEPQRVHGHVQRPGAHRIEVCERAESRCLADEVRFQALAKPIPDVPLSLRPGLMVCQHGTLGRESDDEFIRVDGIERR